MQFSYSIRSIYNNSFMNFRIADTPYCTGEQFHISTLNISSCLSGHVSQFDYWRLFGKCLLHGRHTIYIVSCLIS